MRQELRIDGMHCASCARSVERALLAVKGVKDASVSVLTKRATVESDPSVQLSELIAAVTSAGYSATPDVLPQRTELQIDGMTCASCSEAVERALRSVDGVEDASVNLAMQRAVVDVRGVDTSELIEAIRRSGYGALPVGESSSGGRNEAVERDRKELEAAASRMRFAWIAVAPVIAWMTPEMFFGILWPTPLLFHLGMVILAAIVLLGPGRGTMHAGFRALTHRTPTMDTLIALGTTVSLASGVLAILGVFGWIPRTFSYAGVAGMIMAIHLTGRWIEATAKGRASSAIRRLLTLGAKTARILRGEEEVEIPVDRVQRGDVMVVRPGERIPTDGVVLSGSSYIDESLATGESVPVKRSEDDPVIGATINGRGFLRVRATKIGADTFLAQIVRLMSEVQASKVPIQALADRVTRFFVPVILALAAATFALWLVVPGWFSWISGSVADLLPWVDGSLGSVSRALYAAIAVLVIACPCALGLATPTALMVGSGIGSENGILFRSGAAIQLLREANHAVFDKTGTLTMGRPTVTDIVGERPDREILGLAASIEAGSEHPVGTAIASEARTRDVDVSPIERFETVSGKGVRARVGGADLVVGTREWLREVGIADDRYASEWTKLAAGGKTVVGLAAVGGDLLGLLAVADRIKPDAARAIVALRRLGLTPIMVTGDSHATARSVARIAGIDRVISEVLPEEKVTVIEALRRDGSRVVMIGDGINDAPALAAADVGVALGSGTDIAIEAADVTLIAGDLESLVRAVRLSRATFRKIRQNLLWAFAYNIIAIPLAMLGLLHPLIAEAAMAFSSISVVTNANRLRRVRFAERD